MAFHFQRLKKIPLTASALALVLASPWVSADRGNEVKTFKRIATFPVFLNSSIENETVAEIVAVSKDGKTLIYTDGKLEIAEDKGAIGFVDIKNAENPKPDGYIIVGGEPTSVAVNKKYALAAVNTSEDFIEVSGKLVVIDIKSKSIVTELDLGGQPDSIAVSPNGQYAAVVIENERDEDLSDGRPPQSPPGKLVIVDLKGKPADWTTRNVDLTELDGMLYSDDPEPEYVDINKNNIAVVTLQENNHIVLVDLVTGDIVNHFSAGEQALSQVDIEKNKLIELNSEITKLREPDGVSWIDDYHFATADEGDLDGGGRGFTIFDMNGSVTYESAESVEHIITHVGHYPEKRAGKKGNEPENVEVGTFKGDKYLFVGSERSSVSLVYNINDASTPVLTQVLPTSVKPEGLLVIPQRKLFVAAGEEDARDDKIRSALTLYQYDSDPMTYPTVVSATRTDGTPIPWGALSGLAAAPEDANTLYTIHDSFYEQARIFQMDLDGWPALIHKEIVLKDKNKILSSVEPGMVNPDGTVNLDQEGIAISKSGGFWVASEGKGTGTTRNLILGVAPDGEIKEVIELPDSTNARQEKFGFEGVTSTGTAGQEVLYVAFQREWKDDPDGLVRIGRYDVNAQEWRFYYYPLQVSSSEIDGYWIGLSEITALDDENFLVIERDNQANADASIKRIYRFSVADLTPLEDPQTGTTPAFPVVEKTLVRDLMVDLHETNGLILEKVEGLAVTADGELYIVNDNDGVDDSNGETQLLKIEADL